MRFLKKIFLIFFILLAIIVLSVGIWLYFILPDYNGEKKLAGIKNNVEVYYDEYATPHIYANNNEDAWQALCYVHAQDRLFQMELLRRVGAGRLAEIFGKDLVKVDKLFRTLGINQVAKKSVKEFFSSQDLHIKN